MVTLQEYLNWKYPTKLEKEKVGTLFFQNIFQNLSENMKWRIMENEKSLWLTACLDKTEQNKIEGGELNLSEFVNLGEVRINGNYLKTPLTKIDVSGCAKLGVLICVNKV